MVEDSAPTYAVISPIRFNGFCTTLARPSTVTSTSGWMPSK
jgi:hypothetical protein